MELVNYIEIKSQNSKAKQLRKVKCWLSTISNHLTLCVHACHEKKTINFYK